MLTETPCTYSRHIKCGRRNRHHAPLRSVENNPASVATDNSLKMAPAALTDNAKTIGGIVFRCEAFDEHYSVGEAIGRGKFAVVKRCTHKASGRSYAAKFLKRRRIGQDCVQVALQEVCMLECALGSPHLVHIREVFETTREIIIVTEFVGGGELQRVLLEDTFEESLVVPVVRQVIQGLAYLHAHSIVHMDIKPQNILLSAPLPQGQVKLCDLGLARKVNSGQEVRDIIGTPDYVAPEVLSYEPITTACDMWSVGVLTYVLLTGCSPFAGDTKQETFYNVSQVALDFPDDLFANISSDAVHFIRQLLQKDITQRLTAQQCLNHPWLRSHTDLSTPVKSPLNSPAGQRRSLTSPCADSIVDEPTKRCRCESPKQGSENMSSESNTLVGNSNSPAANQKAEAVAEVSKEESRTEESLSEGKIEKLGDKEVTAQDREPSNTVIDLPSSLLESQQSSVDRTDR